MEVVEGEEREDHGVIFKRVGPELRVVEGGFTRTIPSQALAVSNKFGLTFFVHSDGFCLAKTQDLVEASQALVDSDKECNAKDKALASIHLPCTQFLSLSEDELVVAACTEEEVNFYNVPTLVQKGREGSKMDTALLKSLPILDEVKPGLKMLAWNPGQRGVFLILSRGGKLTIGMLAEQHPKIVAEDVEAVDWSPDGKYICYITSNKHLHICNSDLSAKSSSKLPPEILSDADNDGLETFVDTLIWARSDSILVSCVSKDVDGEEENSWIFVIASSEGPISKDLCSAKAVSFENFFASIDSAVLPLDIGPYTLSSYIQPWELLVVTNRKCVDDHISLLGWVEESGQSEVYKFLLLNDIYTPRIELQASSDDNCAVGLAVDKTTASIEIPAPNGDSGEKLKPGPVLFCMTLEGNLCLFSMARTGEQGKNAEVLNTISELPEAKEVFLSYKLDLEVPDNITSILEGPQNKSKPLETMAEKNNLEADRLGTNAPGNVTSQNKNKLLVPKAENTHSQQIQKHPTSIIQAPSIQKPVTQLSLDNSKELNKEEVQARQREISSQRQVQIPAVELNRRADFAFIKTTTTPALSEMESEFLRELNKVKEMAIDVENLLEFIEGKWKQKKGEVEPSFTKTAVEDIECRTRTLYKQCQSFRELLLEQRRSINELRDESLQVDTWRVYVQSILEQALEVRYKELWSKQTLHPQLAGMRKRILQADQSLKQQIAELEEHLHNLELQQWQKRKQLNTLPAFPESKNFRCLQSIYDTVNTQMVIAQQLARRLALQSEALKLPPLPMEDVENLMNASMLKLQSMVLQDQPAVGTRARLSSSGPSDFSPVRTTSKIALQTPSQQISLAGIRAGLQDSTRRRRDSVDKLWVDMGAAKTTVKRAAPVKRFNGLSSSMGKDVLEAECTQLKNESLYRSTGLYSGSGTNISGFTPAQSDDRLKQSRTHVHLEREGSLRAKDYVKPRFDDTGTLQSMKQQMPQLQTPAAGAGSPSWPSTTASASTAQVANLSSQKNLERQPQTFFFPNQRGPSSIGSAAPNTAQFAAKHTEAPSKMDVGKRDFFKMGVPSTNQEKGSLFSRQSPAVSIEGSTQKAAAFTLHKNATALQQQGPPEQLEVQRASTLPSSHMLGVGTNQNASPLFGTNQNTSPLFGSNQNANLQARSTASQPFEINKSEDKLEWKGSTEVPTTKLFPAFGNTSDLTSSSTSSVDKVFGSSSLLQKEPLPRSIVQGESSPVPALTTLGQVLPPETARQPWGSSSAESASSSVSLLTKPSNAMPTLSLNQEANLASTLSAVALPPQPSPSLEVPSILSVKPPSVFSNSSMPSEQSLFPSATSVSMGFSPQTVQGPPTLSDEEEMEEEGNSMNDFESSSFSGFGLGSASPVSSQIANPFGLGSSSSPAASKPSNPYGGSTLWNQSSPSTSTVPAGQLFKPASFSIPTPQSTVTPSLSTFGNTPTSGQGGFVSSAQGSAGFGKPSQPSPSGQQALGSALGSFGQTRQIGGPFGVPTSPASFGFATGGGFASAATGGGFASAATGGGFASAATSGGFAGVASGGGFAGLAGGGGFASAATGGGFAGVGGSATTNVNPGGFGAFGGGAFSTFGGNTNSNIFTQMRK